MTSTLEEKWVSPLSSEPNIFANYCEKLGLDLSSANFYDVYGLTPDLFSFTPQPAYALIFLYGIGDKDGPLETRHRTPIPDDQIPTPRPWFSLQTVHNACGTMAALHAILNNLDKVKIKPDSWLDKFAKETTNMIPEQRAAVIHNNDELFSIHENAAKNSNLETPEKVTEHFITFTIYGGKLWELDGRKPQPICHGDADDLLTSSTSVIREDFVPNLKNPLMISLMALSKPSEQ